MVGVGAFDGFQTITPRGSRQTDTEKSTSTGMNSHAGKGRDRGLGKGKPPWFHRPALSKAKHGCSVGTQTEPESIPPLSPTQQRTPRTVLIKENGMKSTKIFHSSTACNTLNRSTKVTSFRQCTQYPSPSVGVFAE